MLISCTPGKKAVNLGWGDESGGLYLDYSSPKQNLYLTELARGKEEAVLLLKVQTLSLLAKCLQMFLNKCFFICCSLSEPFPETLNGRIFFSLGFLLLFFKSFSLGNRSVELLMLSCQKSISHLFFNTEVKKANCQGSIYAISFTLCNCVAAIVKVRSYFYRPLY